MAVGLLPVASSKGVLVELEEVPQHWLSSSHSKSSDLNRLSPLGDFFSCTLVQVCCWHFLPCGQSILGRGGAGSAATGGELCEGVVIGSSAVAGKLLPT